MPAGITPVHLLLVLVIALVVIGPGKLPSVGKALGDSIREFRKATSDDATPTPTSSPSSGASDVAPGPAGRPGDDATS